MNKKVIGIILFLLSCTTSGTVAMENPRHPPGSGTDHIDIVEAFLGIPYRSDGTLDHLGRFTTFNAPDQFLPTPGLNCSGLVLAAARHLLGKNFLLAEAAKDRHGDSGPGALLGRDWDFGWDLILNLTDHTGRYALLPHRQTFPGAAVDGLSSTGFDLHDQEAWRVAISQMLPGRVYLGSLSRTVPKGEYRLLHHHVVLILVDGNGAAWLYHAIRKYGVHRVRLDVPEGLANFLEPYPAGAEKRRILIIEAIPPDGQPLRGVNRSAVPGRFAAVIGHP